MYNEKAEPSTSYIPYIWFLIQSWIAQAIASLRDIQSNIPNYKGYSSMNNCFKETSSQSRTDRARHAVLPVIHQNSLNFLNNHIRSSPT
ncbi:hypothetical protein DSO57_1032767 [Entomophthora muscae]|uniref:Uncharacterized protein n=1 Tax=Entomophthora muscae TaxID=34485 RepID=A0ACC2TBE4_9FUNG|nr:hypothetical protein DSO57_1032767 [Entomophthora muscae]